MGIKKRIESIEKLGINDIISIRDELSEIINKRLIKEYKGKKYRGFRISTHKGGGDYIYWNAQLARKGKRKKIILNNVLDYKKIIDEFLSENPDFIEATYEK